jgi:hypothetical protein
MPLQPSYSRRIPRSDDERASPGVDRYVPHDAELPRRMQLGRRSGSVSLTAGLLLVAAVGAGAIIFPDRIVDFWRGQAWIKAPAGWAVLGETKVRPPALVTPPRSDTAMATPPAVRGEEQAPPAAAEAMLMKAVDYPATTSSIRSGPERPNGRTSLPAVAPQQDKPAAIAATPDIPKDAGPPPAAAATPVKVAALPAAEPQRSEAAEAARPAAAAELPRATPAPKAPEVSRMSAAKVAEALSRARARIERGDIAGARLLLERAAAANDARALLALAETYDPDMLSRWGAFGIKADPAKARQLYEKAADTGSAEARQRMLALR